MGAFMLPKETVWEFTWNAAVGTVSTIGIFNGLLPALLEVKIRYARYVPDGSWLASIITDTLSGVVCGTGVVTVSHVAPVGERPKAEAVKPTGAPLLVTWNVNAFEGVYAPPL
jgi:hypothetical protein